jgi:phenylpyruvate tautomerase PptA (4-oxalocrotonate tautomerase family)
MPYLKIQTNRPLDSAAENNLMQKASSAVADALGKPEKYVLIEISSGKPMLFAGSNAPLAYLELKSIGLPESETSRLSQTLCDMISQELGIQADRVYIEFANAERHMWGWNNGTF